MSLGCRSAEAPTAVSLLLRPFFCASCVLPRRRTHSKHASRATHFVVRVFTSRLFSSLIVLYWIDAQCQCTASIWTGKEEAYLLVLLDILTPFYFLN